MSGHLMVKTHDQCSSSLDPVISVHLSRPEVDLHHKRGPTSPTGAIGIVVAGASIDTCVTGWFVSVQW